MSATKEDAGFAFLTEVIHAGMLPLVILIKLAQL